MIRTLLIVGLLATTGASEASARSLVGKWDCNGRDGKNLAIRMLLDYRQSSQFYHLANIAMGDRRGRIDGSFALNGKWFRNHGKLSETVNHARVRSVKANGQDISKTPIGRHITRTTPKRMLSGSRPDITNVRFISNNKVTMTSGRMTATCTKR